MSEDSTKGFEGDIDVVFGVEADDIELTHGAAAQHGAVSGEVAIGDLKSMIVLLSQQISETDRQNSQSLAELRMRLDALAAQSRSARADVPVAFEPAFRRVDDAIGDLAREIARMRARAALADHPTRTAAEGAEANQADIDAGLEAGELSEGIQGPAGDVGVTAIVDEEPAARPSDLPSYMSSDDFDGSNWDADSAEALTRLYEAELGTALLHEDGGLAAGEVAREDARVDGGPADDQPVSEGEADADATGHVGEGLPVGIAIAELAEGDRDWLDGKFAEIAEQIGGMWRADEARVSVDALTVRIGALETQFDALAAREAEGAGDDGEILRGLEASVLELANEVAEARAGFGRVEAIEQVLASLGDKVSDERLSGLIMPMVGSLEPPAVDFEAIAQKVAAEVTAQARGDNGDLETLRTMVAGLIDEQRTGDERTNQVLDTIQEAMVRVLDRMDAVEQAQIALVEHAQAEAVSHRSGNVRGGEERVADDDVAEAEEAVEHRMQAPIAVGEDVRGGRSFGSQPAMPSTGDADRMDDQGDEDLEGEADAEDPAAVATQDRKRREWAESARIAALRANERAKAEEAEQTKPARTGGTIGELRAKMAEQTVQLEGHGDEDGDEALVFEGAKPAAKKKRSMFRFWAASVLLVAVAAGAAKIVLDLNDRGAFASSVAIAATAATAGDQASGGEAAGGEAAGVPVGDGAAERGIEIAQGGDVLPGAVNDDGSLVPAERTIAELSAQTGASLPIATSVPAVMIPRAEDAAGAAGESGVPGLPAAAVGPMSLRLAAANGNASAEFEVGSRYADGQGVAQNFQEAKVWYERASKRGLAIAQYRLATLLERGLGGEVDKATARKWYENAAAAGNVKSMHNLAVMIAGTEFGRPDYKAASAWFIKAAERGLADSQYNLAILHQNGLGVEKSLAEAYRWFSLAARSGDGEAQRMKDTLGKALDAKQRAEVDLAVRNWRAEPADRDANDPAIAGSLWQSASSNT